MVTDVSKALETAVGHHQAGRLGEAEEIYRRILAVEPNCAEAWHLIGAIAHQVGNQELAVQYSGRAVELRPDLAEAHHNLGLARREQRKLQEAVASFRQAIRLKPAFAETHYELGFTLQALELQEEAISAYRRAVELNPDFVEAHTNLGNALRDQGALNDAAACYRRALELKPDEAKTLYNVGLSHQDEGKFGDAIAYYRRALELNPFFVEAHHNLGGVFLSQGKYGDAAACFERAVELRPDLAEAQNNLASLKLLSGDFERGWPQYEWRWKVGQAAQPKFQQPQWGGRPIHGETILLHTEQGFGDAIQFIRYVPLVKDLGASVLVGCPRRMANLLATCAGIDSLVGAGDRLPPFDVHAPLMSLPGILKTTLVNIPDDVPYLHAKAELVERWRNSLGSLRGFRIGINWHGREGQGAFRLRDISLEAFAALTQIPSVRLVSLQKDGRKELAGISFPIFDPGDDVDTAQGSFMDTAAIMKNLDLVITSDTAVAHLAGALAVPVWVALPFVPNWRWLLDRSDSPWYPTMRLFRQKRPGEWSDVFSQIEGSLRSLATPQ